jgi:hypothetical protein
VTNSFGLSINGGNMIPISTTNAVCDISQYLSSGLNNVRITNTNSNAQLLFQGITLGEGSKIEKSSTKAHNFLFIGDSITAASVGYSYQLPRLIDSNSVVIARSGIALRDGFGSQVLVNGVNVQIGMETQFDKMQNIGLGNDNYDPSQDNVDIVFVNLGTNDAITASNIDDFKTKYTAFLERLRNYYPNAAICVVKPFRILSKIAYDQSNLTTQYYRGMAFDQMYAEGIFGGNNVYYIDTTNLDLTYMIDTIHPDEGGHTKATKYFTDFLKANGIIK